MVVRIRRGVIGVVCNGGDDVCTAVERIGRAVGQECANRSVTTRWTIVRAFIPGLVGSRATPYFMLGASGRHEVCAWALSQVGLPRDDAS